MALQTKSISANGTNGHHKFTLNIVEDSTNVANNNSAISWTFVLSSLGGGYDWNYSNSKPVEYTVTVNGAVTTGVIYSYDGSSTVTVKSGSSTIAHNADGTKSISFSFSVTSLNQSFLPGSASASSTMTLTTIPRAATITAAPNFSDGENPTITYSNPAGNAVTSLKACISYTGYDDVKYRDIPKTGSSYTFTLTEAEKDTLRAAVTSGMNATVKFYIATVIGGQTYRNSVARTFSLTDDALPTLNPTIVDINTKTIGYTGDSSKLIRYMSNASFTAGATANKGAIISSQYVMNGEQGMGGDSGTIYGVESDTFNFYAQDSRGNKVYEDVTVDMIPYVKPTVSFKVTPPDTNGTAYISISGKYYNGAFSDTSNNSFLLTVYMRDRVSVDPNRQYMVGKTTFTLEDDSYYVNNLVLRQWFTDYTSTYEVWVTFEDSFMEVEAPVQRITGKPVFDWSKDDFHFGVDVGLDPWKKISGSYYLKDNAGNVTSDTEPIEMIECNGLTGELSIGLGQYQEGVRTNIYGTGVYIGTNGEGLNIDGYNLGENRLLWSGNHLMGNGASITLNDNISNQQNGIVLVFSLYRNNTVEDVSINSFFVSKYEVDALYGAPHTFMMGINSGFSVIGAKYLNIYDNQIKGNATNTTTGENSGITFDNSKFVLRYVIGV